MNIEQGVFLIYTEAFEEDIFHDFADDLNQSGIPTMVASRPDPGPQACLEWLMPTTIVAGISAGFLSEMGKDLYQHLKVKLSNLTIETMRKPKIEPFLIGTKGKVFDNNPYSNAFSIYSDATDGNKFKLLIPKYSLDADYNKIVFAYLDFLQNYNQGAISALDIGYDVSKNGYSSIVLVHFNESTNRIEWLSPIPSYVREQ
ncbi:MULTISPECIES: hypothetical protein [Aeromonas]|uniref:hypothetical protein n=1 Tax=Aeromonas TaxID=642 RepID=UPI001C245144|nr:hypothetical protein [Aeromonas sp. FDAARGOS 1404]QWZ84623.1 hypothetical protein I6L34_17850 [Aeromonas sp. FDAARGOS 1404]